MSPQRGSPRRDTGQPRNPYTSAAWQRVRAAVLKRDALTCQIRGDGCTTLATQVDHIISPKLGGQMYDMANLRAACAPCNGARGAYSAMSDGWRMSGVHIVLHTRQRPATGPGRVVLSLPDLVEALGNHDAGCALYRRALDLLTAGRFGLRGQEIHIYEPGADPETIPHHERAD